MQHVELFVEIFARRSTVYKFLSKPECFKLWMGEGATLDYKLGGDVTVHYPNGDIALGRVLEMVQDRKLVLAWGYKDSRNSIAPESTKLTIELEEIATGTRVRLLHEGLPDQQRRDEQQMGWGYYFNLLGVVASQTELADKAIKTVSNYIAAWNAAADTRQILLDGCWEPAAVYRDRFGSVSGKDALHFYIQNAQRMMPGISLEQSGPLRLCLDSLTFPWAMKTHSGNVIGTGRIFGDLSIDGLLRRATSFWDDAPELEIRSEDKP